MLVQCRLQIHTIIHHSLSFWNVCWIYITLCCIFVGFYRLLSWKLVTGLQNVSESSIQYANDNADLLASVNSKCLDFTLILELSIYSTGILVRSWLFCNNTFHVRYVLGAWLEFVGRFEQKHSISVHWGWTDIESSLFKPPQKLTEHGKYCCKQPTPNQKLIWIIDWLYCLPQVLPIWAAMFQV